MTYISNICDYFRVPPSIVNLIRKFPKFIPFRRHFFLLSFNSKHKKLILKHKYKFKVTDMSGAYHIVPEKSMNHAISSRIAQKRSTAYVLPRRWLLLSIATRAKRATTRLISRIPLNRAPSDPIRAQPIYTKICHKDLNFSQSTRISI